MVVMSGWWPVRVFAQMAVEDKLAALSQQIGISCRELASIAARLSIEKLDSNVCDALQKIKEEEGVSWLALSAASAGIAAQLQQDEAGGAAAVAAPPVAPP